MSDRQHTLCQIRLSPPALPCTRENQVTLTLQPAPENSAFSSVAWMWKDQPLIPALAEKVQKVERATTIAEGSVKVHTVEHVLSALTAMGVDNAIVEMDANEPPIADGSSLPFVQLIKTAGIQEQKAARRIFEIREPLSRDPRRHPAAHRPGQEVPRVLHQCRSRWRNRSITAPRSRLKSTRRKSPPRAPLSCTKTWLRCWKKA